MAEPHEIVELGGATVHDAHHVVSLEAVVDTATRNCADAVARLQSGLEVGWHDATEVGDRSDVDTLRDDELRPGTPEQVLDG